MRIEDMTTMTPEWTRVANDIQIFVIQERKGAQYPIKLNQQELRDFYNKWSRVRGIVIENTELALWCMEYIRKLMNMPLSRLKAAADMDGLKY